MAAEANTGSTSIFTSHDAPAIYFTSYLVDTMFSLSACDECFKRKRKCHFDSNCTQCVNCKASSLQCTKTRRQGRIGRPPNVGLASQQGAFDILESNHDMERARVTQPSSSRSRVTPNAEPVRTATGNSGDSQRLPGMEDETLYAALDIWMFGSTFAHDFYRAIHYCYQNSPWLLHEMFIAMDTFLDWARFNRITSERVDIGRGALSLQRLRTAEVAGPQDALAILMLGQALAAFDAFVTSAGAISILRYSLSLVRPWYPSFALDQFLDPVTISPIFWDIACCLVHRELPVIRPILRGLPVVDRLAGLCTSLLPILYDICAVGHDMHKDPTQVRRLDALEEQVRHWNPDSDNLQ